MHSPSASPEAGIYSALLRRGLTRRAFLRFSAAMATALALPAGYAPRIADAVASSPRLPVVWVRGQACGGDTAAFLHSAEPTAAELLLDLLSVDYHPALMAGSGAASERDLADALKTHPNGYIAVVEGAIPTADEGTFATIGGRAFRDVAAEVCAGAIGTIAVGACAFDGGASAAAGGRTGAAGVAGTISTPRLVALPGCPVNVENLAATIVHYLTFHDLPVTDGRGRPLFAYGGLVHNQCERRAHFEFGEFVLAWGDEGAQKGWCLYKMGCKGPETFANCPTVRYAEKASWTVKAGHGCVGCTMPGFWDGMGSAYRRLPSPIPLVPGVTADQVGQVLVGGVAAMTVAHGAASMVRGKRNGILERRAAKAAAGSSGGEQREKLTLVASTAEPRIPALEPGLPRIEHERAEAEEAEEAVAADVERGRPDEAPVVEPPETPSLEPPTEPWTEPPPEPPDEPWTEPVPEPATEPWIEPDHDRPIDLTAEAGAATPHAEEGE